MKKEFQIKEPCYAARENMQEIPGGSFCGHCAKKYMTFQIKQMMKLNYYYNPTHLCVEEFRPSGYIFRKKNQKLQTTFFNFHLEK